jgi:rod shape-determining protein MreD
MKEFLRAAVSLIIIFMIYSVMLRITHYAGLVLNLFSLAVIYFAMKNGEKFGSVYGMICGLVQDSFSMGVFGVAGIAKTVMGFFAGYVSRKIDVVSFRRNFLFMFFLMLGELCIWTLIYVFVYGEPVFSGNGIIVFQPFVSALLGASVITLIRKKKSKVESS